MSSYIPVPPGFTAAEYLDATELAVKLRIVSGVVFALFLWDYLVLLPQELMLYGRLTRATLRLPAFWCFVVLRYAPFLATAPAIAFSSFNVANCQVAANASFSGVLLMVAASGGIFVLRVLAFLNVRLPALFGFRSGAAAGAPSISTGKRIAALVLVALYVINVGLWIAVLPGYTFTTGPPTPHGSNCINPHTYRWSAASYGASLIFDSYVLVCTIVASHLSRSRGLKGSKPAGSGGIMRLILRDGLLYFAFATAANLVTFAMNLLPEDKSYLKSFATPFASFAITTMGQRVFLNLRLSGVQTAPAGGFFPSSVVSATDAATPATGYVKSFPSPHVQQVQARGAGVGMGLGDDGTHHILPIVSSSPSQQWQEKRSRERTSSSAEEVYAISTPMRAYRGSQRVYPSASAASLNDGHHVAAQTQVHQLSHPYSNATSQNNSPDPSNGYISASSFHAR